MANRSMTEANAKATRDRKGKGEGKCEGNGCTDDSEYGHWYDDSSKRDRKGKGEGKCEGNGCTDNGVYDHCYDDSSKRYRKGKGEGKFEGNDCTDPDEYDHWYDDSSSSREDLFAEIRMLQHELAEYVDYNNDRFHWSFEFCKYLLRSMEELKSKQDNMQSEINLLRCLVQRSLGPPSAGGSSSATYPTQWQSPRGSRLGLDNSPWETEVADRSRSPRPPSTFPRPAMSGPMQSRCTRLASPRHE